MALERELKRRKKGRGVWDTGFLGCTQWGPERYKLPLSSTLGCTWPRWPPWGSGSSRSPGNAWREGSSWYCWAQGRQSKYWDYPKATTPTLLPLTLTPVLLKMRVLAIL